MYVIMGATGHVGSGVVETLLDRGAAVTVVTREARHAERWRDRGVAVATVDLADVAALRAAFRRGRRAFLLNPPGDTSQDSDALERASIASILAALDGSGLEKVVAESTGGARPGERVGDLTTLWQLEEGLRRQGIPAAIDRAAYYFSNWDALLPTVRDTGRLPTLFPADLALPMVAPKDLGRVAADRLQSPLADVGVRDVEGPRWHSSRDVADAFAEVLGRPVAVEVVPREAWLAYYRKLGFSAPAAESYARMTGVVVDGDSAAAADPIRGTTTLQAYVRELVARAPTG